MTAEGQPCTELAPGRKRRCAWHRAGATARLQSLKKAFIAAYAGGTVSFKTAAEMVRKDPATIWRWRKADPAFDAAFHAARDASDTIRVGLVEDSLFARIIAGKAAPAETIFFLKNRGAARWRDRTEQQITGRDGTPLIPLAAIRAAVAAADSVPDDADREKPMDTPLESRSDQTL